MSRKFNRLESIKFENETDLIFEDRKKTPDSQLEDRKKTTENQAKQIETNFKNDQQSKIMNVNIFHLLKSYRFVMNCIHATLQNAFFILVLQLIVPYLCAPP